MGKWDYPAILHVNSWYLLKAALQKAGTLDSAAIADLIHKGMEFESAYGFGRMVPRPDLNNPLAVDALWGATMGQVDERRMEGRGRGHPRPGVRVQQEDAGVVIP